MYLGKICTKIKDNKSADFFHTNKGPADSCTAVYNKI